RRGSVVGGQRPDAGLVVAEGGEVVVVGVAPGGLAAPARLARREARPRSCVVAAEVLGGEDPRHLAGRPRRPVGHGRLVGGTGARVGTPGGGVVGRQREPDGRSRVVGGVRSGAAAGTGILAPATLHGVVALERLGCLVGADQAHALLLDP